MSREIMGHFIKSCEKEAKRQQNKGTQQQDDDQVTRGTLEEAGALDLNEDQGNTYQPGLTSTPMKVSEDPLAPFVKRDGGDDDDGVSNNNSLAGEDAPAFAAADGQEEEIAEICLPEVQAGPEDEDAADNQAQEDARSVTGALVEDDVVPSRRVSGDMEVTSSIDLALDTSFKNSSSIDTLRDCQRKQCLRSNSQHAKSMDEMEYLKYQIRVLCSNMHKQDERINALEANRKVSNKGVETWKIPYDDLKRNGKDSIPSQPIHTPSGGNFQAKLFLNGIKEGLGTHLSLVVSETNYNTSEYQYRCGVQVVNLGNGTDSFKKEGEFQMGIIGAVSGEKLIEFNKLLPLKWLKDPSPFLVNGILVIVLTVEEI